MATFWYNGDIAEAVNRSKSLGAVFVVYIEGTDDNSQLYTQHFTNDEIVKKFHTKYFVAIKIAANSLTHRQFCQIYPDASIPSIYFIGKSGEPLEVVTGRLTKSDLVLRIDKVLEKSGLLLNADAQSESTSSILPLSSESSNTPSSSHGSLVSEDVSIDEKLKHAQELLEQKRLEKAREEAESERRKEIERRNIGKNVQEMKKWQKDEELKQLKEDREKEKRENEAARARILAQIAQDKADRATKFAPQSPPTVQASAPPDSPPRSSGSNAKLQFRLPDGSSHTHNFEATDTLSIVRRYVQTLNLSFSSYTLSTTFPRREFTSADDSETLSELKLVPNAVILVLPLLSGGQVSTNPNSGLSGLIWWALTPVLSVLGFIKNFIFGTPPTTGSTGASTSSARPENHATGSPGVQGGAGEDPAAFIKNLKLSNKNSRSAGETTVIRRQGNVHRLADRRDEDDDNNTWNGNSTQQM